MLTNFSVCGIFIDNKRINANHRCFCAVVERISFGDKEIAVKIRGNSHYRNSVRSPNSQVGMLIALCIIKVSWAIRGDCEQGQVKDI